MIRLRHPTSAQYVEEASGLCSKEKQMDTDDVMWSLRIPGFYLKIETEK